MKYTLIGAGIGGLTTGLAFEKQGIDYEVFEKSPVFKKVGAGIWLSPNALQVYDHLHLLEELKTKGNSIDRITIGKPDLSPISDTSQDFVKAKFGYSTIAIHRAELQQLLLSKLPKEKIQFNKSFESFQSLESGKTEIQFQDGTKTDIDRLIGADGIHSNVRKHLFPKSKLRYTGQTCWRGIAYTELNPDFDHRAFELWGKQTRFGFSRIAKGQYYWFAVALAEQNGVDHKETIQLKLLERYKEFHTAVHTLIMSTPGTKIIRNDIIDLKPLKSWHKNNICLIGDAGHATTPNMGQGGAQAIEDAYYLSHIIANPSIENVFQSFQNKRQTRVNSIVSQSWTTGKMAHWKYGKSIRNLILGSIPKSIIEKKFLELYSIENL